MSNRTYTPEAWVAVEINSAEHGKIYKILGGWYGGFSDPDYWRLSSGVESVTKENHLYTMPQSSGSTYVCHEDAERMSGLMASTLADFEKQAADSNGKFTIREISIADLVEAMNKTR